MMAKKMLWLLWIAMPIQALRGRLVGVVGGPPDGRARARFAIPTAARAAGTGSVLDERLPSAPVRILER